MNKEHKDPETVDLKAPRLAQYMHKAWKKHQNTVCWVDIKLAQMKGLKFYQTRSNAIILYNTLPAYCTPKAIKMEIGEVIYEKVYASLRPHPKISLKHDWMKELGSEVARQPEGEVVQQSKSSQSGQPNPNRIHRTGRPVLTEQTSRSSPQEIDTRFLLGCENTSLSVERIEKDKDTDENADADRVRTGRLVKSGQSIGLFTQREEIYINFRMSALPHAVVKQAQNFCVRELVKKIESYLHREAFQADLQQNNVYNPFSDDSKAMIRDMGNVELFELCETIPKVQCSECLLDKNQGIVYCTCGHLLRENQSSRRILRWQLDLLSIPNYVIKKVRPHGNRHGKTEEQTKHFIAHNLRKRCIKKGFEGIHDRLQKDVRCRDSQLKTDQTEAKSIEMDEVSQKDLTYYRSSEEFERYKKTWSISLNTYGRNSPMKLRSDFSEALTKMHRLHRESGEERPSSSTSR